MKRNRFYKGEFVALRPGKTTKPVIIVSKKISNKAVVRNKLRRQLRELLKTRKLQSVIVTVLRLPEQKSFVAFANELDQCLKNTP